MGVVPGLMGAIRGWVFERGEWVGETGELGEQEPSEEEEEVEESESECARPRAWWMGMGWLCGTELSALEDMVVSGQERCEGKERERERK